MAQNKTLVIKMIIIDQTGQTVAKNIKEAILNQRFFWSDDRIWFNDFKHNGQWISCKSINNELTQFVISIF